MTTLTGTIDPKAPMLMPVINLPSKRKTLKVVAVSVY